MRGNSGSAIACFDKKRRQSRLPEITTKLLSDLFQASPILNSMIKPGNSYSSISIDVQRCFRETDLKHLLLMGNQKQLKVKLSVRVGESSSISLCPS